MSQVLKGKCALITGASSGIGEATARKLVAEGANVVLFARRAERIETLANELGEQALAVTGSVTSHADLLGASEQASNRFGGVDILINNAGIMPLSALAERRVEDWDRTIDVNIKGVLYAIDAVLPGMLARESGHVVNISSLAGLSVMPNTNVYACSKFAVRAISDGLRMESDGKVRVTTIYPGAVQTELAETIPESDLKRHLQDMFKGEAMSPAAIADAIFYALSQPPSVGVNDITISPPGMG
ncbi:SDR family oxidoreductase [Novosphingobium pentaromativorans]|uniref:Putative short-chain dehydrogenase/reductase n=1 Tax=Novosphingobium pentaromativorans US6-1 TaxID=1088721 RepID=G6EGF9_9SPHN|nr:SDR family oxidoreductase [Novosphingobium pentaromativorans]AIT82119.1 oxidoreductase [Novosphingobium pentaromativorans US6-1]EHJ59610.1 Putative short-chain dehydrogenase/reductase [Novosphingobium pentaromativorans US6-1]